MYTFVYLLWGLYCNYECILNWLYIVLHLFNPANANWFKSSNSLILHFTLMSLSCSTPDSKSHAFTDFLFPTFKLRRWLYFIERTGRSDFDEKYFLHPWIKHSFTEAYRCNMQRAAVPYTFTVWGLLMCVFVCVCVCGLCVGMVMGHLCWSSVQRSTHMLRLSATHFRWMWPVNIVQVAEFYTYYEIFNGIGQEIKTR